MKGLRERGRKFGRKASLHFITYNCWLKLSPSEEKNAGKGPAGLTGLSKSRNPVTKVDLKALLFFERTFPSPGKKNFCSFYASFFACSWQEKVHTKNVWCA